MIGKYNFPKIKKVTIRGFSLYTRNNLIHEVNEEIGDGVFCLAGANGLGKTTFLNAINYGLTGMVLEPDKEVFSPKEIYKSNKHYTEHYFKGRIKASDEQKAEIELNLEVQNVSIRIVRGFFELDSLRNLEVYKKDGDRKIQLSDFTDLSPQELNKAYKDELVRLVGLNNFDFYVFLQLYVFTFDENRRMIFWDDRASTHTLSIAFNTDLSNTEKIISLKRDIEKHESDGRNSRWQATQIQNKMKHLIEAKNQATSDEDSLRQYQAVIREYEKLERLHKNINIEYNTLLKNQSYVNSEIFGLKNEHKKLFSMYVQPRSRLLENTYIKMSLANNECCICHSSSEQIHASIEKNLHDEFCPLCGTAIVENGGNGQEELMEQITILDKKIAEKNHELDKSTIEINSKKAELDKIEFELNECKLVKEKLENTEPTLKHSNDNLGLSAVLESYEKQFAVFDAESKDSYIKRDKLKKEFEQMQNEVEKAYEEAKIDFVPLFKKFAKSFIGLDLNIVFQKDSRQIKLALEMQNTARTNYTQLSESQRFFLDIALRMALSIYLSKQSNEATILIDTPEGSLDIAYENRVGQMFADFVQQNQNIIMTANINASQLLKALARRCGNSKMKFRRMLEWTDLSLVQKEGEELFNDVYRSIEAELEKGAK